LQETEDRIRERKEKEAKETREREQRQERQDMYDKEQRMLKLQQSLINREESEDLMINSNTEK
jgi:hypothetical protein